LHVVYTVLDAVGPAHERTFTCAAMIDGEKLGEGTGQTKKAAEQEAAQQVLELLATEHLGERVPDEPAS
jgi:ribonuclease-3